MPINTIGEAKNETQDQRDLVSSEREAESSKQPESST